MKFNYTVFPPYCDNEKENGVEGTSPDLPKPLVTGKQGNKSSIMPTKIKTTNLTL